MSKDEEEDVHPATTSKYRSPKIYHHLFSVSARNASHSSNTSSSSSTSVSSMHLTAASYVPQVVLGPAGSRKLGKVHEISRFFYQRARYDGERRRIVVGGKNKEKSQMMHLHGDSGKGARDGDRVNERYFSPGQKMGMKMNDEVIKIKSQRVGREDNLFFTDKERDLIVRENLGKYSYEGKIDVNHFFIMNFKFYIYGNKNKKIKNNGIGKIGGENMNTGDKMKVLCELFLPTIVFQLSKCNERLKDVKRNQLQDFLESSSSMDESGFGYLAQTNNGNLHLVTHGDSVKRSVGGRKIVGVWAKGMGSIDLKGLYIYQLLLKFFHLRNFLGKLFVGGGEQRDFLLMRITGDGASSEMMQVHIRKKLKWSVYHFEEVVRVGEEKVCKFRKMIQNRTSSKKSKTVPPLNRKIGGMSENKKGSGSKNNNNNEKKKIQSFLSERNKKLIKGSENTNIINGELEIASKIRKNTNTLRRENHSNNQNSFEFYFNTLLKRIERLEQTVKKKDQIIENNNKVLEQKIKDLDTKLSSWKNDILREIDKKNEKLKNEIISRIEEKIEVSQRINSIHNSSKNEKIEFSHNLNTDEVDTDYSFSNKRLNSNVNISTVEDADLDEDDDLEKNQIDLIEDLPFENNSPVKKDKPKREFSFLKNRDVDNDDDAEEFGNDIDTDIDYEKNRMSLLSTVTDASIFSSSTKNFLARIKSKLPY